MRTIFSKTKKEDLFPEQIGDYELISLMLESPRDDKGEGIKFKQYGLDFVYSNFSIYEDLYSNCLTGSVTIVDGNHLLTDFPIIGEETIEICFRSMNTPICILLRMRVTGISPVSKFNENSYMYTLYLTSNVAIESEKQKISKAFNEGTISQMVEYICIKYLKMIDDSKLNYEKEGDFSLKHKDKYSNYFSIDTASGHQEKYIAPYFSPFRLINKLCQRAVSTTGSLFFFFQDINKFRFVSLEDLFKKRESEHAYKKLLYIPADNINRDNLGAWNIVTDYKVKEKFDVFKNMSKGMYSSQYTFIDVEKRNVKKNEFYYQRDAAKFHHVNNDKFLLTTNHSDITHKISEEDPTTVAGVVMFRTGDPESQDRTIHFSETLQRRLAMQASIEAIVLQVVLPGDSSGQITVGDIVEFVFPKLDKKEGDAYLSGKYLVTRINHSVDTAKKYSLIVELVTDTISNDYQLIPEVPSSSLGIKAVSKEILLEHDDDLVMSSVLSLDAVDNYHDATRKRFLQKKTVGY